MYSAFVYSPSFASTLQPRLEDWVWSTVIGTPALGAGHDAKRIQNWTKMRFKPASMGLRFEFKMLALVLTTTAGVLQ